MFHGCQKCFPNRDTVLPVNGLTANEAFQNTLDWTKFLKQQGYSVIEMWECNLKVELQRNPDIKDFFDSQEMQDPLDPRNCFYGGCTNVTKLWHKVAPGEKIQYIDICSLYLWVCKYGKFPVGHPKVITENFVPISTENRPYEGTICCKILPPRGLLHPVLLYQMNNKLTFPLCKSCADDQNKEQCEHGNNECSFWGTWIIDEIYKALELWYKLLDVSEIWHYEEVKNLFLNVFCLIYFCISFHFIYVILILCNLFYILSNLFFASLFILFM